MRSAPLILVVVAMPSVLFAQETVGPSPSFIVVSKIDTAKGTVEHATTVVRHVPVTREREVVEGGVVKKVAVTELVPSFATEVRVINLRAAKVFDVKGKSVPVGEALNKIKVGHTLILSASGGMIHRSFAQALRDDVLIVALPSAAPVPPR
ncbi:MAG: hypothetical protein U0793_15340 [Gemmataceae bacterium]